MSRPEDLSTWMRPAPHAGDALHLCDLTTSYHPTSGGIRTYLEAKRCYLRDRTRARHTLIIPAAGDFVEEEGRLRTVGVASPPIPGCAPYRFLWRTDRVGRTLAELNPDIVEVGCPYLMPWAALRHRKRHGGSVVGFYHTDFPRAYVEAGIGRLLGRRAGEGTRRLAERYGRSLYRRLDLTLVASSALERRLRTLGVERTALTPLGVDTGRFRPDRRSRSLRASLGVGASGVLLVFAGRLDAEKRIDVLVRMMRHLPAEGGFHLVLVGNAPRPARLRDASREDPRIHVLPFESSRERLADLLASADLYVSAAPHETFGLSVVEAQASGLPVVGVRAGAMIERVPPETGALVEPDDPEALARGVLRILDGNPRAMGAAARTRVLAEHSWDAIFDRLFQRYTFLAGGRSRAGTA